MVVQRIKQTLKWDERPELVKTIFLLLIVVVATLGGYGLFMLAMGTTSPLVVVTSGSMRPTLYEGDLLVLQGRPIDQIQVGDIIVFVDDQFGDGAVVHRVVQIEVIANVTHLTTRGDNNIGDDPGTRVEDELVGVMVLRIPALGNVSLFLQTDVGRVLVIAIFIAIIVVPEVICNEEEESEEHTGPSDNSD
jgi:signal peptidase